MEKDLSQLERRSRFRKSSNPALRLIQKLLLWALPAVALLFNFEVPSYLGAAMLQEQYLGMILILVLSSVFLCMPASRRSSPTNPPWYDLLLSLLSIVVGGYLVVYYPTIVNEIGELTADKVILGTITILLVMESCRRMTGWVMVIRRGLHPLCRYAYLFPGILNAGIFCQDRGPPLH
jgi:TRAP-type uncharacterized transport system fused permease subunit